MRSKEDVLKSKTDRSYDLVNGRQDELIKDITSAMDEYAEQESIGFAEWVGDKYSKWENGMWTAMSYLSSPPTEFHTTKELYQLYLKTKEQ